MLSYILAKLKGFLLEFLNKESIGLYYLYHIVMLNCLNRVIIKFHSKKYNIWFSISFAALFTLYINVKINYLLVCCLWREVMENIKMDNWIILEKGNQESSSLISKRQIVIKKGNCSSQFLFCLAKSFYTLLTLNSVSYSFNTL